MASDPVVGALAKLPLGAAKPVAYALPVGGEETRVPLNPSTVCVGV